MRPPSSPSPPLRHRPRDTSDQNLVNQIYERDGDGVGFITATGISSGSTSPFDPYGQSQGGTATGSGFLIDNEGHMVTNNHVIEGAEEITVTIGDSDETYEAEVVGTDPSTDLALIKVDAPEDGDEATPARPTPTSVKVGDPVVAIGNPFGLDRTVTTGIVSALQREISEPQRVRDLERDPDRRGDQPRQLRRPADQHRR